MRSTFLYFIAYIFRLCALVLYISGGSYSLTSTRNDKFLRNFFMACFFTLRVFLRYLLRGNRESNFFFYFVLMSDLEYEPGLYG